MKKNITITVNEEDLTKFKEYAAKERRSVSNMISYLLAKYVKEREFNEDFDIEHMPDKLRPSDFSNPVA